MITINIPDLKDIRYKINGYWWRLKIWYLCYSGDHITYDNKGYYKQVGDSPRNMKTVHIKTGRVPIMNCRRCGKRVNEGLHDEYFSGDKKFEHA
jgi:hypothetical protein